MGLSNHVDVSLSSARNAKIGSGIIWAMEPKTNDVLTNSLLFKIANLIRFGSPIYTELLDQWYCRQTMLAGKAAAEIFASP
jgi:hypothetical protein